jgi:hypothetical protein
MPGQTEVVVRGEVEQLSAFGRDELRADPFERSQFPKQPLLAKLDKPLGGEDIPPGR